MQNLTRFLAYHARVRPRATALVYEGRRVSYAELLERALRLAGWLSSQGIGADSVVALLMRNSPAFLEACFALSHLGAVSLPLNYRLSLDEVRYITEHARAAMLLADAEFEPLTSRLGLRVESLDESTQRDSRRLSGYDAPIPPMAPRGPADLFRLMYTSGTTDRPKGVIHSYGNEYWKSIDHVIALELCQHDRLCVVGPLYHVGAFDLPGIAVLWMGGTMVLLREFEPHRVLETIAAEGITGIWLAPVMTNAILALGEAASFDVSSLKWCIGGGERTPESRIRTFMHAFPNARYIDAYGMTETVSGDTLMEPGFELEKIGSTGRALAHCEIEIRDDDGQPVKPGEPGEICIRGEKVTAGYWRDAERTAAAFWPHGWLRSGDVGYLDGDGFLFLTDRKKDLIISGGENIASSEVERVLYEMPQVLEAAVIGRPDPRWGERPVAVIVLRPGEQLTLEQLTDHCSAYLARFKVPRELVVVDTLPRNPSGKVLKRRLRETLEG